ncbi:acetyl esterase/lipase [Georgenia soli]|uniref:Acetyl esterase/lipase n=1 Tax=Georgenia soli TaxID=638953 RepID=A0A2A9F105_9MICO|nr:alpha/beta hydrolase [Georgenia soli]PFG44984.1 acetyl esterase/lipase [Georgenia soli]
MTETTTPRLRPPAPAGLSEQARQFLDAETPFTSHEPPDDPLDTEGWLRYVEAANEALLQVLSERLPTALPELERERRTINGVPTFVLRPGHVPDEADTPLFLDIHGGALVLGGGEACAVTATGAALMRKAITWAVDYRMPPLHPYPAALNDCLAVYRAALKERPPERIVVSGGSAGGNLAAALLLRARDEGLPMPAVLVLLTPEVDLTESGDSFRTNLGIDHQLGSLIEVNRLYADGHDLSHPYLSPLFAELAGLPPTYLQTGTRDLFLSNTVRMHRKLRAAGVEAELHVGEAMPHGGFGGNTPEDLELAAELHGFIERHL